jgi:hypothetical protein
MKTAVILMVLAVLLATSFVQESDAFAAGGGAFGKKRTLTQVKHIRFTYFDLFFGFDIVVSQFLSTKSMTCLEKLELNLAKFNDHVRLIFSTGKQTVLESNKD